MLDVICPASSLRVNVPAPVAVTGSYESRNRPLGVSEEHGIDIVFSHSLITVASVPSFWFLVLSLQAPAAVVGERWPPLVGNAVRDFRT